MSKTYIDFFETLKGEFIASHKFRNKFIRLWGTTTVDDVEVMKNRFNVYPGLETDNVKKFLKLIGSQNSFKNQDFSGITDYYFVLNSKKANKLSDSEMGNLIASKINEYIGIDGKATVTLTFTGIDSDSSFDGWTKDQIVTYIINNYDEMFNYLHDANGDYLVEDTAGEYLLFDKGQHLTYRVLASSNTSVPYYASNIDSELIYSNQNRVMRYLSSISIQVEFTQVSYVNSSSNIIAGVLGERTEAKEAKLNALANSTQNSESSDGWGTITTDSSLLTDEVWYKGHMRLEFLNNKAVKTKSKIKVLLSALDTGYATEKVKWWKKILGPVLIVIAVILAVLPGGQPLSAVLFSIALNVGIAVLVMTGLQVYFAKQGDPSAAAYMGRWVKIGSLISLVSGVSAMISNITRMAAQQAAVEATKQSMIQGGASAAEASVAVASMDSAGIEAFNAANSVTVEVGIGNVVSTASDMFLGTITSSWQSMISTGMKVAKFAMDLASKFRMEATQSEINSLTQSRDEVAKELEDINDKEIHIGLENIRMYTSPLTIDNVRFQVDYLYEGTKMNVGRPSFYTARGSNIISNDVYDTNKI